MQGTDTPEEIAAPVVDPKSTTEFKTSEGYRQLIEGNYPGALLSFEEALRLNPRASAAKTGKGMVLARQGNLLEAERLLRESLLLNPDPSRTHYELGLIYQKMGDHQRAATEFKQGIEKYRDKHP
jgi:Flp pilus assembly protein TadD